MQDASESQPTRKPLKVIQVVKRFGPIGGMEHYVFKLCEALAQKGIRVRVLCEKSYAALDTIEIIELGATRPRPRWMSMLRFSTKVTRYLDNLSDRETNWIVHSHERCARHHVTTFHGPPMAPIKQQKRFWWASLRLATWLWLEKREVERAGVVVLPNSEIIRAQLAKAYPDCNLGLTAWPAVNGLMPKQAAPKSDFVFAGREYHRKGLPELLSAIEASGEAWTLSIVGARQDAAFFRLINNKPWVHNQPWVDHFNPSEWGRVLVHPAKSEPYGMVVAEARAAGLGVVVSPETGAAGHQALACTVLSSSWDTRELVSKMKSALGRKAEAITPWTWHDLAELSLKIYSSITP